MDFRIALPNEVAELPHDERAARVSQLDAVLHLAPDRFFIRAIIELPLGDGGDIGLGSWIEIDPAAVRPIIEAWNDPEAYSRLEFSGRLAGAPNALAGFDLGAPVTVAARHPDEIPYVIGSGAPATEDALNRSWDRTEVVNALTQIDDV